MKALHIVLMAILIIGVAGIAPVAADLTVVPMGGVVFVGEEGLTFAGLPAGSTLTWFAPGDDPMTSAPSATYTTQGAGNEVIDPTTFQTRTGNWYVAGSFGVVAINVQIPSIDVKVYNSLTAQDMTNNRVIKEATYLTFRLDSNLYNVLNQRGMSLPWQSTGIKVVVIDEEGATYTALYNNYTGTSTTTALTNLFPCFSQYYLPGARADPNWALDRADYNTGTYTFYAQVNLNNLMDNLGTVTGVTKSDVKTLEVVHDYVTIEANKDTVTPEDGFSVTISGRPHGDCVLWVAGTSSISAPNTVPYIKPNQNGVMNSNVMAGAYTFNDTTNVTSDVCQVVPGSGSYYAMVRLSDEGTRTVGFGTDETTKEQAYTIRTDYYSIFPSLMNNTVQVTIGEPAPIPPAPFNEILTLKKGWNLISSPVGTPAIDTTGYLYQTVYAYNATTGSYEDVLLSDIVPGEGYWVGAFADAKIEFTGDPLTEYQKSLAKGWNLAGGIGIETDIRSIYADPEALSGPIYHYNTETHLYSQATSLEPGLGYWISTSEPCTISVNITPPVAPA